MDSLLEAKIDPSMSKLHGGVGGGRGRENELLRHCPNDHPL